MKLGDLAGWADRLAAMDLDLRVMWNELLTVIRTPFDDWVAEDQDDDVIKVAISRVHSDPESTFGRVPEEPPGDSIEVVIHRFIDYRPDPMGETETLYALRLVAYFSVDLGPVEEMHVDASVAGPSQLGPDTPGRVETLEILEAQLEAHPIFRAALDAQPLRTFVTYWEE